MKRQTKDPNSKILQNNWTYPKDRTKIREALLEEQKRICAYTKTYLVGRTDAKDIDHFNPKLEKAGKDGYQNWFLTKHQWNKEKSAKWDKFQPILHPAAEDFEQRITYKNGEYRCADNDKYALHLIELLNLNEKELVKERRIYIENRAKSITRRSVLPEDYFKKLLQDEPNRVYFIRAIEEEFNIKIDFSK